MESTRSPPTRPTQSLYETACLVTQDDCLWDAYISHGYDHHQDTLEAACCPTADRTRPFDISWAKGAGAHARRFIYIHTRQPYGKRAQNLIVASYKMTMLMVDEKKKPIFKDFVDRTWVQFEALEEETTRRVGREFGMDYLPPPPSPPFDGDSPASVVLSKPAGREKDKIKRKEFLGGWDIDAVDEAEEHERYQGRYDGRDDEQVISPRRKLFGSSGRNLRKSLSLDGVEDIGRDMNFLL